MYKHSTFVSDSTLWDDTLYNSTLKKTDTFSLAVNKSYMYVPRIAKFLE